MDEALDFFNHFYEPARRHQDGMAEEWIEYERAYYGEPEQPKPVGDDAWRSYLFYKYGFQQAKTLVAELAADDAPTFQWEARNPAQDDYANVVQSLISFQLQRDSYASKRLRAIEWAAIYGGCPIKVHWTYKHITRKRVTAFGLREERYCVLDQPTMTLVDPTDFMYDPRARTMAECRYAFHRMRLTHAELKERKRSDGKPLYKNLDQLEDVQGGGTGGWGTGDRDSASSGKPQSLDHDYAGERDRARRQGIEVVEMWTRDRIIVRAAGNVIIRDEPNPFWHGRLPFEVITLQPSLNDVWGLSLMWQLRDVQELLWTLDNAAMDALKLGIDPPIAVDISDDAENAEKPIRPRERFISRTPGDAVHPIKLQGLDTFVSAQAIQSARDQLEYITGINRSIAGQSNADTATQAALDQRQAKGRIGIMMGVVDEAFARIAEMFLALDQQYLDLSKPVRVLGAQGSKWLHLAPSDIGGMWDVRPKNSSEKVIKELHRQNLMEAMSALQPAMQNALPSGKAVDITPIVEELAKSFDLPVDRIIVDANEMRQQHQQDVIADGTAQAQVQQMIAPPEPQQPEAPPEPMPQMKLFESMNYKDIPPEAQAAMLQQVGLPSSGVHDATLNPTQDTPQADPNGISEGLKAFNSTKPASGA